jgi:diguanylate cyclase (GGDEF)-like protein
MWLGLILVAVLLLVIMWQAKRIQTQHQQLQDAEKAALEANEAKFTLLAHKGYEVDAKDEMSDSASDNDISLATLLRHPQPALESDHQLDSVDYNEMLTERKHHILIVDDMPSNIKLLANGLKDYYTIYVANSGAKAVEIAQQQTNLDLVLLDIMMPGMNGYDVCRVLKNDPKTNHIPIVFVSALDEVNDEEKGLDLGAVDYIIKPFHMPIVKARVRNHINLKLKTDMLEKLSLIDGLTQIANRRFFDDVLTRESQRMVRDGGLCLGIIMLDIDYFKPYNDHYGHGVGDECLKQVAQSLAATIRRPADSVARYGGEEFVVVLPETTLDGVMLMAEKMRQAIAALAIPHGYSQVTDHVTISLGASAMKIKSQEDGRLLLAEADKALYQAKEQGRNRVVSSLPDDRAA